MPAVTPFHPRHDKLGEDASRYVDLASLPWKPTPTPDIDMKVLMQHEASGLFTGAVPLAARLAAQGQPAPRASTPGGS